MQRPEVNEYHPGYQKYIDLAPGNDFPVLFDLNTKETIDFFKNIPPEKHDYRYAEGKWTIKEVLMHIIDTERVFAYRALAAARGDETPVYRMDEELYARNVDVTDRTLADLISELAAVRTTTRFLFEHVTDEQSRRMCNIVTHPMSTRAIGYFMLGHAVHHTRVVKERY